MVEDLSLGALEQLRGRLQELEAEVEEHEARSCLGVVCPKSEP